MTYKRRRPSKPLKGYYDPHEGVYVHAPLIRSRQEMDEIDYISEIAMDLFETDPEDRRPRNWKPLA